MEYGIIISLLTLVGLELVWALTMSFSSQY
jgi:hypothetical protein